MASITPDTNREQVLAKGWEVLEGAPAEACRAADLLLKSDARDVDAALLSGMAYRRLGNLAAARRRLAPLVARPAAPPAAWREWGLILAGAGDDAGAVDALRQAVALAPAFAAAWRALGDQLLAMGRPDEAVQAYAGGARASHKDTPHAGAAAALAEGRAALAEATLRAHLRLFPADVRAIRLLAEAAMRLGRMAEAADLLTICLERAPGFAEARHSLAALLYRLQRFADAAAHMKMLLDLVPHQPALRILRAACF